MRDIVQFIEAVRIAVADREGERQQDVVGIAVDDSNGDIYVNFADGEKNRYGFEILINDDVDVTFNEVYDKLSDYVGKIFTQEDLDTIRSELIQENSNGFVVAVNGTHYRIEEN